jgi:single-strand DNA-binding protein
MNNCAFSGNLTRDPELRRTQTGVAVANFSIAVNRPGEPDKTDFINCYAWRTRAEFVCKYFSKGQRIEVCGPMTSRNYEKNGERRTSMELRCDYVNFGERKREDSGEMTEEMAGTMAGDFEMMEDADSELPF